MNRFSVRIRKEKPKQKQANVDAGFNTKHDRYKS